MTISDRRAVTASQSGVAEAATAVLAKGNAIDAVVAGIFAAAALSPVVLLGPVQILIGGAGVGLRAIDGRVRQPGLGAPRPRGFITSSSIPDAARVASPALPAALAVTLATGGTLTLNQTLAPALELARDRAAERFKLLRQIARGGPSVLADAAVAGELVAAAGRVAGGLLTAEDLASARPQVLPCIPATIGGVRAATVPWGAAALLSDAESGVLSPATQVIAAADLGLVAVACYETPLDGVEVPELGLRAPLNATPVRRGETRVRPGELRVAAAPIAITEENGLVELGLGVVRAPSPELWLRKILCALEAASGVDAAIRAPRAPHEGSGAEASPWANDVGVALGVARSREAVRALSDPRGRA